MWSGLAWRATACSLIVTLLAAVPLTAVCGGWTASAAERMACCQAAGHQCDERAAAGCCAAGERHQNADGPAPLVPTPSLPRCAAPADGMPRSTPVPLQRTAPTFPVPHDRYLFGAAFLI